MVLQRREYYKLAYSAIFETIYGTPPLQSGVRFEYESEFMLNKEYMLNYFELLTLMTQQDSRETDEELNNTLMLSPLVCPTFQVLDSELLDIDIEYGGLDQVSVCTSAICLCHTYLLARK